MNSKTIIATYSTSSTFSVPADVTEWDIHWDVLTYTDKDGNMVEVEPDLAASEDQDLYHRPSETYEEFDKPEEPPEVFYRWADDLTTKDLLEMLWNRMKPSELKEILEDKWLGSQSNDDESESTEESEASDQN